MFEFYIKRCIKHLLFALALTAPGFAYAQHNAGGNDFTEGVVSDDFGNPVENVSIAVQGQDSVYKTDENGYFRINAGMNSVVVFSHPQFYPNKLKVRPGKGGVMQVSLVEKYLKDPERLHTLYDEVDKKEFLGSASTIHTNQLASNLDYTYASALAGQMAGLYTQQFRGMRNPMTESNSNSDLVGNVPVFGRGAPNDNTQFFLNVRGQSPVMVIDGVQRNIFSLDPENIESISIQKDALSSILLGMRSSRGVMVVTTKQPIEKGFQLSFTGRTGVQTPLNLPDPLPAYQYAYLLNEALQNDGKELEYSYEDFEAFRNGSIPITHPDVNWYNTVLEESAPISSYNLNVSGGSKVARYYVSLSYLNQQGHFITSGKNKYDTNLGIDRYLVTSKIDVDVTSNLAAGVTLFARVEEGVQPGAGVNAILSDIFSVPNGAYPVFNPDGSYGGNVSFYRNLMSQTVNSGYINDNSRDIMANIDLDYDLSDAVKGLSFKAITNISSQSKSAIVRSKQSMVYEYIPGESGEPGSYSPYGSVSPQSNNFVSVANYRYWYGQLSLNYNRQFGEHKVGGKLFGDQQIVTLNYDLPQKPVNLAAKGAYSYADKYFVEAAINRAKYNGYRPGKQWGTFYAFGLGWDIAREDFLSHMTWLDQLKLRGVNGRTGSGIDNAGYYEWRQSFQTNIFDYSYPQGSNYSMGEGVIENTPLANPNITWEKANKLNAGIDVLFFNNRLALTGDYYYDKYYDLLQTRGKSIQLIGMPYPNENIGKANFSGIETSLTYQNSFGSFNYYVTANWSQNHSKLVFMDEQYTQEEYNRRTGRPLGARFGLVADGFFSSMDEIANSALIEGFDVKPGDIKYKDLNEDGVINQYDQTAIANTRPLTYYGLTTGFNFKGFDFSVLLQGVYNRDIYVSDNILQAGFQGVGQSYGQAYSHMINRWTPETAETAAYPRLTAGGNSYNHEPNFWSTSFWVKSGNYFRVKNISLGYTLPTLASKRLLGAQVKVFMNAQNLFTKAAYDLVDPEVIDFRSYPIQRVISGGVNFKF